MKSDGIFSFQPPINILALVFLWPARAFVTPHTYHKIIVFAARLSNLPLLLIIRIVERHFLFREQVYGEDHDNRGGLRSYWKWVRPSYWISKLDYFGGTRTELNAVFEYESDIDDDSLPGGAFDIHDGVMTPANVEVDVSGDKSMQLGGANIGNSNDNSSILPSREREGKAKLSDYGEPDMKALIRERSRQRRTQSMSDWGGTIASGTGFGSSSGQYTRRRPTILSKLYGYGSSRQNIHARMPPLPGAGHSKSHVGSTTTNAKEWNEDTVRTPNTAGSRISWPLSSSGGGGGTGRSTTTRSRFDQDEEEDDDEEEHEEDEAEAEEERRNMRERLERIEEGQKRIEEALKALGGGD